MRSPECLREEVDAFIWMQSNDAPPHELEMFVDEIAEPPKKPFTEYRFARCDKCAVTAMFCGSKVDSLVILEIVSWARNREGLTADTVSTELDNSCRESQYKLTKKSYEDY